jgi:uncharacterized repeat protein (TIGR02543 family)
VTYNKNGNDVVGAAPIDFNVYQSGATVIVLGNTGNFTRTGYTFLGWHTDPMASKAKYVAGSTFNIPPNSVTLFAVWSYTGGSGGGGISGSGQVIVDYDGGYQMGNGSKQHVIVYDASSPNVMCVASNLHDLDRSAVIENLVIEGSLGGNNSIGAVTGILLQNVCNCLIRNVTIKNCEVGIRVKLTSGVDNFSFGNRFEHIRMINVKTGILFEGASDAKDFSCTTIDDVGISLAGNASDVGIRIGSNANLFSSFIKANVWLSKSKGTGLDVNGQIKSSLVNFTVEQDSGYNGYGVCINLGAIVCNNQSFLLTAIALPQPNRKVDNNNPSVNDVTVIP